MFHNPQVVNKIKKFYKRISKKIIFAIKQQIVWLLQTLFVAKRRRQAIVNAGFVLPTVAMVALVVVLLTTAILFRSFERAKNASNVRVNEAVLNAALPALERAKAKIEQLFGDPRLPSTTPSDDLLSNVISDNLNQYTFGDEIQLKLIKEFNKTRNIQDEETLKSAWKYPVDTDNNSKFDSYTLYGIYFRNPPQSLENPRPRSPLEARTPPMLLANTGSLCDVSGDISASLVGSSGWYKLPSGELKKSFFVYVVTISITTIGTLDGNKYEVSKGNKGFSALELQEDRSQLLITNNAVVYEDDLDITPSSRFRLNGRIFTNSNFFTGKSLQDITLLQVSSKESCYYNHENGKIIVGGNLAGNGSTNSLDNGGTQIDLFNESATPSRVSLASSNKSTNNAPQDVAYNSQAYAERIDLLIQAQQKNLASTDPKEVQDNITRRITDDPGLDVTKVRNEELEIYFRKRTRRVPFAEVSYGSSATGSYTEANVLQGNSDSLRPPDAWVYPTDNNTRLTLKTSELSAIDPQRLKRSPVLEQEFGDRILVGNNLPELRWDDNKKQFLGKDDPEEISGQNWKNSDKTRTRSPRVTQLADLGATGRDRFWERSAALSRVNNALDVVGGLRVVTGAGVYQRTNSFLPLPPTAKDDSNTSENEAAAPVVWFDIMPMLGFQNNDPSQALRRGDLVMRATVVYHYNLDAYAPETKDYYQTPIACISSYYNPTNATTATTNTYNPKGLDLAASNNGLTYQASATKAQDITRGLTTNSNGLFSTVADADNVTSNNVDLQERLKYQANLVFPNNRFVNPLLRQALKKPTNKPLTLSEQSAIDSTICAIQIADGTINSKSSVIPDGAIKETAFLDARQIKAIDQGSASGKYDLEIEQRQPLEIRATVIDLDVLRKQSITGTWSNEYLLPNSGIIYATRDDAQPDRSDPNSANVSATDYKLDPERRPNAIMLINGGNLSRQNDYRSEEKGFILATDLPVYIKGNFNLHTKQEFKNSDFLSSASEWDSKFYTRASSNRDSDFACRPNDPRLPKCTTGETWRPAAVIADAVTLLSNNFQEGYRNDGDYDLRNNQIDIKTADTTKNAEAVRNNRLKNGFWDNNFVTSSTKVDDSYYSGSTTAGDIATRNSSYLNNFVTPIQRRANFPEYVMEMCFKLPVSECKEPADWVVGYDSDGNSTITDAEKNIKSSELPANADVNKLVAGTTAKPAKTGYDRFARRVAFKRDFTVDASGNKSANYGKLLSSSGSVLNLADERPIALGIKSGKVDTTGVLPDSAINALWFATISETDAAEAPPDASKINYGNDKRLFYNFPPGADASYQPLIEPVIQLQVTTKGPQNTSNYSGQLANQSRLVKSTRWLSTAKPTTFNLVVATGDTPARVGNTLNPAYEENGGLHNFVRLLENWDGVDLNINGSFIQFTRSVYATAPFQVFVRPSTNGNPTVTSLFTQRSGVLYLTDSTDKGEAPYYMPPNRNWSYDVALLSQLPDLFAQRFTTPSTKQPSEFYREVGRDDAWVKTLLCAAQNANVGGYENAPSEYGTNFKYAVSQDQRGTCP